MKLRWMFAGLAALAAAVPAAAQSVAIVHARAWTGTGAQAIDDATIVVRDGRIESISRQGSTPPGMTVIDARGRAVTPGIFAGVSHLGLVEVSGASDTADEAVTTGKLGPSFDVTSALNPASLLIQQARADGVLWTLAFPSGSSVAPFLGQGALLRLVPGNVLRRSRAAMFVRIGGGSADAAGGSRAAQWTLLRQALDEAGRLGQPEAAAPEDRVFTRIDLEALRPVLAGAMPLAIQTHRQSDIRQAIRIAADYRLRVVLIGAAEAWTIAGELAAARIPVIVDPGANLPMSYDEIGARPDNAAILARAGVVIGISPSAHSIDMNYNAGVSSRMAAGLAVANGLPYSAAIRALTSGPASIWGADAEAGAIAAGRLADLVIWDGDPLEPSSAPTAVIVNGSPISTVTREQLLTRRYSPLNKDTEWPPAYR